MQYRKFGSYDFSVSVLGFGCMRLPILNGSDSNINEEEAIKMIRFAIDNGVNYIDTAYPYHKKQSEVLVGKALLDGYRERVKLATKLPCWLINTYEDFDKYLSEQLNKLQTDHIDMYLLHALGKDDWEKMKKLNIFKFLEEEVSKGRIRYPGFSFHDELPVFKEIVDSYDWAFCQIQYNYMDENYQAGTEGLEYAASKGLAVIVMEPLRGGKLAQEPPFEVQTIWNESKVKRTPAEWALRWIWNRKEVTTVLSGMSTMDQVVENIRIADSALVDSLNENELHLVNRIKEKYKTLTKVNCTGCNYCMPCPSGVNIPRNFSLYNDVFIYNHLNDSQRVYNNIFSEENRASACIECGKCEEACPQNISIREHLKNVHNVLKKEA